MGNPLDSEGICSIIEACRVHRVSKLNFKGLHLTMGIEPVEPEVIDMDNSGGMILKDMIKAADDSVIQDELDDKALEIEQLKIENPGLWERLMTSGELENAGD